VGSEPFAIGAPREEHEILAALGVGFAVASDRADDVV
jgi:hypothetical protein